ncbi:MAG TPA: hypothetical protein PLP65_05220 [Bacteroidales bacterium]|nr:hypothetical protein [Bacteroidales bacterium]HOU98229.1 hypothetical protein [Bacteroidales bacterium]
MKCGRYLLIFILIGIFSKTYAQNQDLKKLQQAFGNERFNYLQSHHPDSLEYYKFVCENGFRITDKKYAKPEEISKASLISLPESCFKSGKIDISSINIFLLPVEFLPNENHSYSIEGTDYLLILHSKDYLQRKFSSKPH